MNSLHTTITTNIGNPDSESMVYGVPPNISFNEQDVSILGLKQEDFSLSYSQTTTLVELPTMETKVSTKQLYFSPVYSEKISYEVWMSRRNKVFEEFR